jgi:hypothetical protein
VKEENKFIQVVVGKFEGTRTLGRPRSLVTQILKWTLQTKCEGAI